MSVFVAGHKFNTLSAGEHCQGENCHGIGSLVELIASVDQFANGEEHVAHAGPLNQREIDEIKNAREEIRKAIEDVWKDKA